MSFNQYNNNDNNNYILNYDYDDYLYYLNYKKNFYFNSNYFNKPFKKLKYKTQLARTKSKHKYREPGLGVGVFLIDAIANKILIGKRKDSGLYGLPGGWLEKYEDWSDCAARELKEETGLMFNKERFHCLESLNCQRSYENYHAISLIMYSEIDSEQEKKEVKNLEPHKCEKWIWVTIDQLRQNITKLFYPLQDFLNKYTYLDSVDKLRNLVHFDSKSLVEKKKNVDYESFQSEENDYDDMKEDNEFNDEKSKEENNINGNIKNNSSTDHETLDDNQIETSYNSTKNEKDSVSKNLIYENEYNDCDILDSKINYIEDNGNNYMSLTYKKIESKEEEEYSKNVNETIENKTYLFNTNLTLIKNSNNNNNSNNKKNSKKNKRKKKRENQRNKDLKNKYKNNLFYYLKDDDEEVKNPSIEKRESRQTYSINKDISNNSEKKRNSSSKIKIPNFRALIKEKLKNYSHKSHNSNSKDIDILSIIKRNTYSSMSTCFDESSFKDNNSKLTKDDLCFNYEV